MFQSVHSNHLAPPCYFRDAWKLQKAGKWEELNALAAKADKQTPESMVEVAAVTGALGLIFGAPALGLLGANESRKERGR